MRLNLKLAIIKRLLAENSTPPLEKELDDDIITQMPLFKELSTSLDFLGAEDPVVNFSALSQDPAQWKLLATILKSGLTMQAGSPPVITKVNYDTMRQTADRHAVSQLPQPDYYKRVIKATPEALEMQEKLNELIEACQKKFAKILQTYPDFAKFDTSNNPLIQKNIEILKKNIKRAEKLKDEPNLKLFTTQLTLLEDLYKINQLKVVQIPNEFGPLLNYCQLAESAGGVTEKVSLVTLTKAVDQLTSLDKAAPATVKDYMDHRNDYKLGTQAILKLPKHGSIEEVQREALALNCSRICGLDTTRSSMMVYEGKPVLFVPFDDIRLLQDFAHGKVFKSGFSSSKTYEHYSTIDPVGTGLQANIFIDDFGSSLGVFYLCSDPDFIGGYNQNKALRDGRGLFMFDMVLMSNDKLGLDSRLSLQPIEFLVKHTRHGQGRNRSLIEDSSFQEKFNSLMVLMRNESRILAYLNHTINQHAARLETLNKALSTNPSSVEVKAIKAEIEQVTALKKDAETIKQSVKNRVAKIMDILPSQNKMSHHGIAKGLILEKLINNPVLFTDEGRPYRNPWTYRNQTQITYMQFIPGKSEKDHRVLITFSSIVPPQMVSFLKRHGASSLSIVPHRNDFEMTHMTISVSDLAAIQENMLYPENNLEELSKNTDYLNLSDLQAIGNAYGLGHRTQVIDLMKQYKEHMSEGHSVANQLKTISTVDAHLIEFISTAKDKGFATHVRKKFQFDVQQRLRQMFPQDELPANIDEAFSAALKLDQLSTFNRVMEVAIETQIWRSDEGFKKFKQFLNDCITQYHSATNHFTAVTASGEVARLGGEAMNIFKQPFKAVLASKESAQGHMKEEVDTEDFDDLDDIDPREIQQEQREAEKEKLEKSVPLSDNNNTTGKETPSNPTIEVKL